MQGQPGAASARPSLTSSRSVPTATTCRRSPTRCRRSRSCTRSRCRCTWPASSPTSRPAVTAPTWPSTSPAPRHKWFTFTNGVHVDSLDPATFTAGTTSWSCSSPTSARACRPAVKALAPTIYSTAMGDRRRRPPDDPIQSQPTYAARAQRVREAAPGAGAVRQRRRRRARGRPSRASSTRSRASRSRGPRPARGTWDRTDRSGAHRRAGPGSERSPGTRRVPATDFTGNTGAGGLCGGDPDLQLGAEPAGHLALVPERHPSAATRSCSVPAPCRRGSRRRPRTSTSRSRSRRCGPTARRRSSRTAGCGPASASSTHARARCSSPVPTFRARDVAPLPEGPLHQGDGAAVLRGPRVSGGVSDPDHDRGAEREPAGVELRRDQAEGPRDGLGRVLAQAALARGAAGRARSERAHVAAPVSGAARGAVPPLRASMTLGPAEIR